MIPAPRLSLQKSWFFLKQLFFPSSRSRHDKNVLSFLTRPQRRKLIIKNIAHVDRKCTPCAVDKNTLNVAQLARIENRKRRWRRRKCGADKKTNDLREKKLADLYAVKRRHVW